MYLLSIFNKKHRISNKLCFFLLIAILLSIGSSCQIIQDTQSKNYGQLISTYASAASKKDTESTEDNNKNQNSLDSSMLTASDHNLSVSFSYGFNKASKYGRKMNVIAYVTNNGKDFNGTIGILSIPTSSSEEILYENPCTIASGETKKFELTASLAYSNWPSLLIKDENEHVMLQKSFHVTMTTQSNIVFLGVLTDEPEDIDYISSAGLAKLFFLDDKTLPSTVDGLDSLDILMISNFNTDRLSDNQINAILEWTKKGGMLVFGTGGTAAKTLSAFQEIIFNGTISDVEKRTTLLGMSNQEFLSMKEELYFSINQALDYDELLEEEAISAEKTEQAEAFSTEEEETASITAETNIDIENQKKGRLSKKDIDSLTLQKMPKDMISMDFENFTPILSENDGFDLILKNKYGKGVILAAAFELGIESKYRTSMGTQLYHIITDNFSETAQTRLNSSEFEGNYTLSRALGVNNLSSYPHLQLYFFILLAYALLAGPVLYFILKKLDKRHLLWILMPVSCLICTMIIYMAGSSTRITEPYIHYVSFTKLDPLAEQDTLSQDVYFNIAAPYNKKYSVPLSGISDIEIRGDSDYGMSYSYTDEPKESAYYKTAIYKNNSKDTTLIMNDYASFHAACFRCSHELENTYLSGSFDANIEVKEDFTLTGTLTNNLGINLYQAAYICNGKLYILGSMEHGSTVSLEDCTSAAFLSYDNLENSNTISGESILEMLAGGNGWYSGNSPLVRQIYYTYEYYLTSDPFMYSSDGRMIAITESMPVDFLKDTGLSTSGLHLLDIPISSGNLGSIHIESLDQSFSSIIEGDQDYPNYRYLFNVQTMSYQIKEPETVHSLVYKEEKEEEPVFNGTISAYNLLTGDYDILFTSGTNGSCEDLSPYLTRDGELTLRFNPNNNNNDTATIIPILYLLREQ